MHHPTLAALLTRSLSGLLARLCLFAALLAAVLAFGSSPSHAADAPGIRLPAGQQPFALAWDSGQSVIVLCCSAQEFSLYRASVGQTAIEALAMPKSFMSLKPSDKVADPDFYLAPAGNALAVLRPATAPLKERELLLYEIDGTALREISERLPSGFWPELLAFKPDGSELFMAARNFVNPDQEYSIGNFQLASGKFFGVTLRSNVDVVEALAYLPRRRVLAIRAGGVNGAYPLQPVMLGLDLGALELHVLHTEAAQLQPRALADGRLLLRYDKSLSLPGGISPGREARMDWILPSDGWELEPANLSLDEAAQSLDISPDGAWLGFVALPKDLGVSTPAKAPVLTLQRFSDARTVLTETPCSSFAFSADSRFVCAADADSGSILFFALPQD